MEACCAACAIGGTAVDNPAMPARCEYGVYIQSGFIAFVPMLFQRCLSVNRVVTPSNAVFSLSSPAQSSWLENGTYGIRQRAVQYSVHLICLNVVGSRAGSVEGVSTDIVDVAAAWRNATKSSDGNQARALSHKYIIRGSRRFVLIINEE